MREEDIFDRIVSVPWLKWFRPLFYRYREMWLYALFGTGTFLINFFVYSLYTEIINLSILVANAFAWLFATMFAFYTNRRWVFVSHATGVRAFFLQLGSFCTGRFLTLVIEEIMLYYLIEVQQLPNMLIKLFSQIVVIVLNFFISKWIVFRRKK